MAAIGSIIKVLEDLLEPNSYNDLGPNGLQVPGTSAIHRIATGVTAHQELIQKAIDVDAQLLLVHHGLFWKFHPVGLTPLLAERLRVLFKNDLNLLAYHIPLDAHPVVGNNALLADGLGCNRHDGFGEYEGHQIGRVAYFDGEGIAADELFRRVNELTDREPLVFPAGPERVRSVGIVSGGGDRALYEAIALGLDAFITGEPREHIMADAKEAGIHFIAAGHYATETFGVRRLGELISKQFGIDHLFIDVPNPV